MLKSVVYENIHGVAYLLYTDGRNATMLVEHLPTYGGVEIKTLPANEVFENKFKPLNSAEDMALAFVLQEYGASNATSQYQTVNKWGEYVASNWYHIPNTIAHIILSDLIYEVA